MLKEGLHEGACGVGTAEMIGGGVGSARLALHSILKCGSNQFEMGHCLGVTAERAVSPGDSDTFAAAQTSDSEGTHGKTPGASVRTIERRPSTKLTNSSSSRNAIRSYVPPPP